MNRQSLLVVSACAAVSLSMITGCAQVGATLPSMTRVVDHAKESAREPGTWAPLTAAAVLVVTGADDTLSDWASDNTPIFGSRGSAKTSSNNIRDALVAGMALSSVFAPNPTGDTAFPTRRFAANALAFGTVQGVVEAAKLSVKRNRPNDRDDKSFPSGHSSGSFASAILLEQNLNASIEQPWLRNSIKVGTLGSAAAVAWARVEAKEHFPVDVLVSAAFSNFVVKTFYKAIVTEDKAIVPPFSVEASRQGFKFSLRHSF